MGGANKAVPIVGARIRVAAAPVELVLNEDKACQQLSDDEMAVTDSNGRFEITAVSRTGCGRRNKVLVCVDHPQFESFSFYWLPPTDTTPKWIHDIYLRPRELTTPQPPNDTK